MSTLMKRATGTDEWDVASVEVDAYLRRIDHHRVTPSADALRSLHEAHVRAIPFENVDVVLGMHRGLGLDVLSDKLVHRYRGGYCFEHALIPPPDRLDATLRELDVVLDTEELNTLHARQRLGHRMP